MPIEFIGMIGVRPEGADGAAVHVIGGAIHPAWVRDFSRAHEEAGFDRILIGYGSSWPEGTQVAAHVAAHTERLGLLVAHRPGFVAPTLASRLFATLDQFSGGRVAVHTITGGHDAEQRRDGDYLDHDERYDRTDEYLTILRRAWTSSEPFDFEDGAPNERAERVLDELLAGLIALADALPTHLGPPPLAARPRTGA